MIRDTSDLASQSPIPALWAATAFTGVICIILIIRIVFAFTKLRMVCLIACISTVTLTITNASDTYYPLMIDEPHSLMFGFFTILYFDLIIGIFLNIGATFYCERPHRTLLFWVVIALAVAFSLIACGTAFALFISDIDDLIILILSIFVVVACLGGMLGAVVYATIPLITNKKVPPSQSDGYAVGIWYLSIITIIMVGYITFYAVAFANLSVYNPFGQINQAIDLCFRALLVLPHGVPPNRKVISFIRNNLSHHSSSAITPMSSQEKHWSASLAEEKFDTIDSTEVIIVPAPLHIVEKLEQMASSL